MFQKTFVALPLYGIIRNDDHNDICKFVPVFHWGEKLVFVFIVLRFQFMYTKLVFVCTITIEDYTGYISLIINMVHCPVMKHRLLDFENIF